MSNYFRCSIRDVRDTLINLRQYGRVVQETSQDPIVIGKWETIFDTLIVQRNTATWFVAHKTLDPGQATSLVNAYLQAYVRAVDYIGSLIVTETDVMDIKGNVPPDYIMAQLQYCKLNCSKNRCLSGTKSRNDDMNTRLQREVVIAYMKHDEELKPMIEQFQRTSLKKLFTSSKHWESQYGPQLDHVLSLAYHVFE
jgi:hypothetical protein